MARRRVAELSQITSDDARRKRTTKLGKSEARASDGESLDIHSPLESRESPTLDFSFVYRAQPVQVHGEDAVLIYLLLFGDAKLSLTYVHRADQSLLSYSSRGKDCRECTRPDWWRWDSRTLDSVEIAVWTKFLLFSLQSLADATFSLRFDGIDCTVYRLFSTWRRTLQILIDGTRPNSSTGNHCW